MADPLARNDWIGTREDRWTDVLPQSWQSAINTNPVVNALARYMQPRQSFDQYAREWQDNIPGNSPIDRIAEGRSTIAKEYPSPMNPLAADILEKGGFLANFLSPGAPKLPTPAAPKPQGIKAYHGSPHDFDRFDISKIGTGEGNQAYGHGLYFAEAEGTAKQYRDVLERATAWKKPYAHAQSALRTVDAELNQIDQDGLFGRLSRRSERAALEKKQQQLRAEVARYEAELSDPDKRGKMYEVRINADPERFLDWDKPLAQQPEAVRKAIPNATPDMTGERAYSSMAERQRAGQRTGNPLDDVLLDLPITDHKAAAQALRDAGIPGIRYKDAMSRGTDAGTSNYVVFDAALIEILRKYGLLPPLAAGGALMGGSSEAGASPAP